MKARRRFWQPEEDAQLRQLYSGVATTQIGQRMGRPIAAIYNRAKHLGLKKSAAYLATLAAASKLPVVGAAFRFPKGHAPANKGTRRPGWSAGRMQETQFKKGQSGWNWHAIGSRRLCGGYLYTKISDHRRVPWTKNWRPTHILHWETYRGPVPRGFKLRFKNGDRRDIRIGNLEALTHAEMMRRNSVHNLPQPLVQVVQLLGAIQRRIIRRVREEQDRRSA